MMIDSTTKELIEDCLSRITSCDASGAFDLASVFMSYVDSKDIDINLAVIEALVVLAKNHACIEAANFLTDQWPTMQVILRKRWQRAGFTSSDIL